MLSVAKEPSKGGDIKLTKEQEIKLYANMVRVRKLDQVLREGLMAGKIPAFFTKKKI